MVDVAFKRGGERVKHQNAYNSGSTRPRRKCQAETGLLRWSVNDTSSGGTFVLSPIQMSISLPP